MTVPVMNGIRLMTDDDVVQLLETRFGDAGTARLIDGCARAVAGVSEDGRIIYDYGRLVELFMSHEGMDEGTAAEYVDFNIVGGIAHLERAPILMYPVDWHDGAPDGPEEEWWYGTETLFVNGRHCLSKVMFDPYPIGEPPKGMVKVPAGEGPPNTSTKLMDGDVEIRTDWFKTKEQAWEFVRGGITYIIYRKDGRFAKWETSSSLSVQSPFRGIYRERSAGKRE